jgi:hypothetical protein
MTSTAKNCLPSTLSSAVPNTAGMDATDGIIRKHLESELPKYFGCPVIIRGMSWEAIAIQTSFAAQILTLHLSNGEYLKLFVKDFSSSILPKDNLVQRSTREHHVYRDLLAQENLDTAHYFGAVHKPGQQGFYLLIEFVDGMWLKYRDFDDWVAAAGWLGMLHGTFINKQADLQAADFLVKHDADFFTAKADKALQAVTQFSQAQADQLICALDGYDDIIDIMASQPVTLVHGSFRVQNILVASASSATRICPIDWELAATGGGLHDLAFIAHGYAPDKVEILLDTYREQLGKHCILWANKNDMTYAVNCYLLHKVVKSLSDSAVLNFSNTVVNKYLDMARVIRLMLEKH